MEAFFFSFFSGFLPFAFLLTGPASTWTRANSIFAFHTVFIKASGRRTFLANMLLFADTVHAICWHTGGEGGHQRLPLYVLFIIYHHDHQFRLFYRSIFFIAPLIRGDYIQFAAVTGCTKFQVGERLEQGFGFGFATISLFLALSVDRSALLFFFFFFFLSPSPLLFSNFILFFPSCCCSPTAGNVFSG